MIGRPNFCEPGNAEAAKRGLVTIVRAPTQGRKAPVVIKPRTADLVLVTPEGRPVGRLPAVSITTPWWQDIEPVVRAARDCHGVDLTVLRLLDAELDQPPG